jgi:hypothetical protein
LVEKSVAEVGPSLEQHYAHLDALLESLHISLKEKEEELLELEAQLGKKLPSSELDSQQR